MAQCKDCIHEKVCLHKANIETDTYAYMGIKYDTEKCKHYTSADVVPKGEWISVEDRLPNEKEMVLVFCHRVYDDGGYYDSILVAELTKEGKFVPFNCSPVKKGIVTHWMPLPEAPKMKGGE